MDWGYTQACSLLRNHITNTEEAHSPIQPTWRDFPEEEGRENWKPVLWMDSNLMVTGEPPCEVGHGMVAEKKGICIVDKCSQRRAMLLEGCEGIKGRTRRHE